MPVRSLTLGLWVLASLACSPQQRAPEEAKPAAVSSRISKFLPFAHHTVLSYLTTNDLGEETLVVMEIERPRPEQGEIWIAGHRQSFSIRQDAVERSEGGFLLREPLEVGRTFQGPFGVVRVEGLGETASVPAGDLSDCLRTVEQGANPPRRVETTYCAEVGIAKIEIWGQGGEDPNHVKSVLTAYGPRIDLREAQ